MIISSILLAFTQITFVTWSVIRTFRKYSSTFIFSKSMLTKIGTLYLSATFVVSLATNHNSFVFFVPSILTFISMISIPWVTKRSFEKLCHKGFAELIDSMLLEMKCGKSFSFSFQNHLEKLPPAFRTKLRDQLEKNEFSRKKVLFPELLHTAYFINEFVKIALLSTRQLDQLCHLQKQIRLDALLRHRSRQALLQSHLQAVFLSVLYVGLVLYGLHAYQWQEFKPFLFVSIVFMALGLLLLRTMTRKTKWKT